jgi:hypothetical protein
MFYKPKFFRDVKSISNYTETLIFMGTTTATLVTSAA